MKKYLLIIVCALLFSVSVSVSAQEDTTVCKNNNVKNTESTSIVSFDGTIVDVVFFWKKKDKAMSAHWGGLQFAFVGLDGLKGADLKQSKSYSISFAVAEKNLTLSNHWLLVSGLGLDFTRYHFGGDIGLQGKSEVTQFLPAQEGQSYKASKLLTYYFTIPLMLEYQTNISRRKTFFIVGGMEGLIKYYSKSQVDIRTPRGVSKTSLGRDLNILPINGRFLLKTGVNGFGVFGYYQPFSMFKSGKGPDVRSFGIGLSLIN
jgi:hypothetical protein